MFIDENKGLDRVDGRMKVTGKAKYAAEHQPAGMTYAILVNSPVTKGKIKSIDTKKAEKSAGVLAVVTHLNSPKVPGYQTAANPAKGPTLSQPLRIFYDETIYFNNQPIAMVIADTLERATYAASLVSAQFAEEKFKTDLAQHISSAVSPSGNRSVYKRGEADAYKNAEVKIEQEYVLAREVHNPMELHSLVAVWEGDDKVKVYEKTQGVKSSQRSIMDAFKLPESNVQVIAEYVGGGFGAALRTWPHTIAAVLGAKLVKRPVKLMLTREQMFSLVGYRPLTIQKIGLGATKDGKLTGITHEATAETSMYEEFTEGTVNMSKFLYACPNVNTLYKILPLDVSTPTWMRGPGEATGAWALESAIDELSYALNLDPIELRLRNYAETDPERNLPFSSKFLKECYEKGAEQVGWNKRNRAVRSMREGDWLVGYGMSTGTFGAGRGRASVKAVLGTDGILTIQSAVSDSGPGTATAMTQIASENSGLPANRIVFELGDSNMPTGPTQGGSTTTSTLGSAVLEVSIAIKKKVAELAVKEAGGFANVRYEDLTFSRGEVSAGGNKISYADLLKKNNLPFIEITQNSQGGAERQQFSMYSFSVHFVIVHVHSRTGVVRVHKAVAVSDAGKIVSKKTAESQAIGGVVGGIGMALMEEAVIDHRYGRLINSNLADYHMPVQADVPHIEALFIDKPDPHTNPMGSKGLGEIALIGFAAAVANAVYHATGKRIRELPITPDKIIM